MHQIARLAYCMLLSVAAGCIPKSDSEVVVYTALDRGFSEPILDRFSAESGIRVLSKYDIESTKTVGLVRELIAEADGPRCDVFWNNEILHTLRLKRRGLLAVYLSPNREPFPTRFRDAEGTWSGFAGRARVLLVNDKIVGAGNRPSSVLDLADEQWKQRCGMAKPLAGTTYTHAVCLFSVLGDHTAKDFLSTVKRNAKIMSGNRQVAMAVASGQIAFGLTDTDDAMVEIEAGRPVSIVYPDQASHQMGTLFLPNTIAILKDCPNPDAARQLIDFLLTPSVEEALAKGPSAQIPLNPQVADAARVRSWTDVKSVDIDFEKMAETVDSIHPWLVETFSAAN